MKMNELLSELDDDENYEEELDSIEKGCDVPTIENSDAKLPARCANARRASSFWRRGSMKNYLLTFKVGYKNADLVVCVEREREIV